MPVDSSKRRTEGRGPPGETGVGVPDLARESESAVERSAGATAVSIDGGGHAGDCERPLDPSAVQSRRDGRCRAVFATGPAERPGAFALNVGKRSFCGTALCDVESKRDSDLGERSNHRSARPPVTERGRGVKEPRFEEADCIQAALRAPPSDAGIRGARVQRRSDGGGRPAIFRSSILRKRLSLAASETEEDAHGHQ